MSDEELRELLQELAALRAQRDELAAALRYARAVIADATKRGLHPPALLVENGGNGTGPIDAALAKLEVKNG